MEQVKADIQAAQRNYDLNKAAELQYGKLPAIQKELAEAESTASDKERELVHEVVSEDEISKIVSKWTGIPVAKLTESEKSKTLNLASELKKRVVGQDEAVDYVSDAIIRSKAGIKDPSKPIGSFIFLGPTGVGKTELAKALAENLFDDEQLLPGINEIGVFDFIDRKDILHRCAVALGNFPERIPRLYHINHRTCHGGGSCFLLRRDILHDFRRFVSQDNGFHGDGGRKGKKCDTAPSSRTEPHHRPRC